MIHRSLEQPLMAALGDTPVTMLVGARQTGKSTLVTNLSDRPGSEYLTLDDPTLLAAVRSDPTGFVEGLGRSSIIDEVQRAPELFLPIKAAVDRDRQPGRFLLTGSANPLFVPEVAEALAGRMEVLTLWPLSMAELAEQADRNIVRDLLDDHAPSFPSMPTPRGDLVTRIVRGGFPEAMAREDSARRARWFSNYLTTILERDVRTLADISRLEQMPRLLTAIALRARGPLNKSALSQGLGVPVSSVDRYLALLERVFLIRRLPAWHHRQGPRLVKSPKLLLCDSGLLCHLLQWEGDRLLEDPASFGLALECLVGTELLKAVDAAPAAPRLLHYRTSKGVEVDFILEAPDGRVAAIEVKGSSSVDRSDFRRFDNLREVLGSRFIRGVVFYCGERRTTFGDSLEAWPLSCLWSAS